MRLSTWKAWCYLRSTIYETHYMKNKVLLWSTSVEKEIVALPFIFFGLSFFLFGLSLFLFGQCSNNDDHHTFIDLQHMNYNSKLEQDMTLYECLRRCTGMVQWIKSDMYENYAWWLCHKYDVNYMIMQWQYDKSNVCHDDERNGGKLHGNISCNGYGNAINR